MFEGRFSRRRSKALLILVILSLILFFYRWNIPKQKPIHPTLPRRIILKTKTRVVPSLVGQTPKSVLSSIEFLNSPYLNLESQSMTTIPIIVISKASNIEIRDAIRRTWAFKQFYQNNTIEVKVFFLVGTDDYNIKRIRAEQMIFPDVISVSLPELYSFAAYKELSAMIWVRTYFPHSPFYIKTEDYVIINMSEMITKLFPIIENPQKENFIIGWFGLQHVVERGTYQKYINAVIPPKLVELYYAMGLFYGITSSAADRMLNALSHVDLIEHPGDPFVTGILRDAAQVQIKNLASLSDEFRYYLSKSTCSDIFEKDLKLLLCTSLSHFAAKRFVSEYFESWNVLLSQEKLS